MSKKDNIAAEDQSHENQKSSDDTVPVQPEFTVVKNAHATGDGAMGRHDEESKDEKMPFPDTSI